MPIWKAESSEAACHYRADFEQYFHAGGNGRHHNCKHEAVRMARLSLLPRRKVAKGNQMKALNYGTGRDSKALKERFLQYFTFRTKQSGVIRGVVRDLIEGGIPREILMDWAVEAGYSKSYVASLLSHILVSQGLRQRAKGAGRKPSAAAQSLLAYSRRRYGKDFLNVLRAAGRLGMAELAAEKETKL